MSFRGHFINYLCVIYISVPLFSPLIPQTEHADGGWGSGEVKSLSRAQLFATPWIVACTKLLRPWDFQGKSTGVGCHFLLQGIFPTQGSNPGLSHCGQMLYRLRHQGSPGQFTLLLCQPTPAARLNGPRMLWGPVSFRGHFISYICAIYIFVPRFSPLIPKTEHADGWWGWGGGGQIQT